MDSFFSISLFLFFFFFFSFFMISNSQQQQPATSLSFNFTGFPAASCTSDIRLYGNATCLDSSIIVTDNGTWRTGHAVYSRPFTLWSNSSAGSLLVADFTTDFVFSIDAGRNDSHGDGLTFYLSNLDYQIPSGRAGGSIGLALNNMSLNASSNPFVAVEFDTFANEWDVPHEEHVGFDLSSAESVKTAAWNGTLLDGRRLDARITYNSVARNLCVYYPGFSDNQLVVSRQELCHQLDLTDYLKESVNVGFSASTGEATEFHRVHSWSFSSNLVPRPIPAPPMGSTPGDRGKDYTAGIAIGVAVGTGSCFAILLLGGLGLFLFWRRNKNRNNRGNELVRVNGARNIPREALDRATNNFSEDEKLGEGGFGAVFRGYLDDLNMFVAVKRILRGAVQGVQEYANEIMIISQLRHKNLVQLIGWCHEKRELLLVYEYMENRSLDFHIFDEEKFLDWNKRYRVAQGLASALHYLHEECNQCVLHRDIKANNVMLDANFNPKLGDFGLARLVDHDAASQTLLGGTRGYMAPECLERGKTSKESDVYGFGVVALELATGRRPFVEIDDDSEGDMMHIARWVWELYGRARILDGVDRKLKGKFNEDQAEQLMVVGLWCCHPGPRLRPSIRMVMDMLNFSSPLPNLPLKFPGSVHSTPSKLFSSFSLSTVNSTIPEEPYRSTAETSTDSSSRDGLLKTDVKSRPQSSTDPFVRHTKGGISDGRAGSAGFPRNPHPTFFDSV
ncbi:L-type lectin-domain containing receptor kinase IX.1 [Linum perenne]